MISARDDHQIVTINTIDKTIGMVDPARPESRQILSQRLGLADPIKGAAPAVTYHRIDAL